MHGRPRRPAKPEDSEVAAAKAAKLRELQTLVLHNHHSRTYTKDALGLSFKLLEINPEAYTAWNYRKLAFQHNFSELSEPEVIKSAVDDELRVVEVALRQNPKSYGAWYHRKWLLNQKLAPVDFKHEFGLLDKLLKADARNFHGWNYRRFLARFMGVPDEEELKYTMDKISDNFSNYSAWHNRSILLSNLLMQQSKGFESKHKIFSEEFELVTQALFTDPSDQSGWFYHLWLLAQTSTPESLQLIASWPCNGAKLYLSLVGKKAEQNTQSSVWCYSLMEKTVPIVLYFNEPVKGLNPSNVKLESDLVFDDIASRSGCHHNCPVNVTFSIELVNCGDTPKDINLFRDPISWNHSEPFQSHGSNAIHFDQLKITGVVVQEDSTWHFERLSDEIDLFRDLPDDNRPQDANFLFFKGLQALQHLLCLNLSNNCISSFTALEPLTKIISLKVLDLSFNQIKAHPIDTTRYICPSPSSHKVEACEAFEECQKKNINVEEYWDDILFFNSLNLAQFNVKGNVIASKENFRTLVMMLIPSLKWLDGECVH
ncbi:hypothetical protein PR202_ga12753 [Eleusine coracana subsp. coracana]|uniref:Geranylgeranyl transferase type-2 subunit alpha n=1 Tax=Eleusine coracana subsp. coracana TaxID=191504 RepID=A0AAV5CD21_ELECO|nr:hypothetical protein PR202_ga12753 [Eleusine coracana subsp. coracana]